MRLFGKYIVIETYSRIPKANNQKSMKQKNSFVSRFN